MNTTRNEHNESILTYRVILYGRFCFQVMTALVFISVVYGVEFI